jgi:Type IV pili methyl-accepting chemotaxis transducer N-term
MRLLAVLKRLLSTTSLVTLTACAALGGAMSTAEAQAGANLVPIAGKQRMLSQRALKAYAQGAMGVNTDRAKAILGESLAELKSGHASLAATLGASAPPQLAEQAALINKLSAALAVTPSPQTALAAATVADELLANAEAVTKAVGSGGGAAIQMVNLAARQRMLSQRAAAYYFLAQINRGPELKARATEATSQLKAANAAFESAKAEFPGISENIELARMQLIFFEAALADVDKPSAGQAQTVATTSERILGEMDELTRQVAAYVNKKSGPQTAKR